MSKRKPSSSPIGKRGSKQRGKYLADRFRGHHQEVEVKWDRDAPSDTPERVKQELALVSMGHSEVRKQLDVLRKTRGQREVGTVKVPANLQGLGMVLADTDKDPRTGKTIRVERRGEIPNILPAVD